MVTEQTRNAADPVPCVAVRNVTAGYGDEIIIDGVSFEVRAGEIFAILGRSGCGKTTLFKVIMGLLEPYSGEVIIDGEPVVNVLSGGADRMLRKIGVLFQSGALFTSMTLAENVALPLRNHTDLPETTIEPLVHLKLSVVGLAGYEGSLPAEVSGGMRKRAALARAMALDPKILFFDEPSAGLDPVTSAELDELILQVNQSLNTTIVIVTHELPSILALANRAVMLSREEKNIIAEGSPQELMMSEDPRVRGFFHRLPSVEKT
jgi:phospholipid/cholesterol/gamma-HCH transport system ATP-binding protein